MYRKDYPSGYYPLSDAEVIYKAHTAIRMTYARDTGDGQILTALEALMKAGFGSLNYRISTVNELQIATMATLEGVGPGFVQGAKAFTYLINRFLFYNKRTDMLIQRLSYRVDPSMRIFEMALLTLNDVLPTRGMRLPPPSEVIMPHTLAQVLLHWIKTLDQVFGTLPAIAWSIRAYCENLLDGIHKTHIAPNAITQWDRSFLMHMYKSAYASDARFPKWNPVARRNEDATIGTVVTRLKNYAAEGPKTKYLGVLTNSNPEDLVFYVGPFAPNFLTAIGFLFTYAGFTQLDFKILENVPWERENQLLGTMEGLRDVNGAVVPRVRGTMGDIITPLESVLRIRMDFGYEKIPIINDLPDMSLEWIVKSVEGEGIQTTARGDLRANYLSKWRQRELIDVRSVEEVLVDKALSSPRSLSSADGAVPTTLAEFGTPLVGKLSIDEYSFCDITELMDMKRVIPLTPNVDVFYARGKKPMHKKVDLAPHFSDKGNLIVRPAFAEYLRPRMLDLLIENKELEGYVGQQLGLPFVEQKRNAMALRMSVNAWRLKTLFGAEIPVPDVGRLINMVTIGSAD